MFFRRVSGISLFVAVILFGSVSSFAQSGMIGGRVFKIDADGKQIGVEGVRLDCYRTDIKQKCRTVKTDKKGDFVIIGLPYTASVVLGVSGPGIAPTVVPEKKVGAPNSDKIGVQVNDGDGRVPDEAEVRDVASRQFTGQLTEEQKKEQAELEKKRLEILESNKQVEARNKQRLALLKEGEAAYNAKDYKTAITKFDEGYKLDPEFIGSAPTFLNNLAAAYKGDAVMTYNEAAKTKQSAVISQARPKVAKAFTECLTAALKAHDLATNAKPEEIIDPSKNTANAKFSEELVTEAFRILGKIKLNLAGYVGTAEEAAASVALYKSSLEILPRNSDVLAGLTFALYTSSALTGSETEKQSSLDYGAFYLASADKAHSLRAAVTEIVDLIKSEGLKPKPVK